MPDAASSKLSAANLEKLADKPKKSKAKKGAEKPAWARTEKQTEEAKEAEIDELLEFAYELDYEKFMEDQDVRTALALIKNRVEEMTKETNWKDNEENFRVARSRPQEDDQRSHVTYNSQASAASKMSYQSRVNEAKATEAA